MFCINSGVDVDAGVDAGVDDDYNKKLISLIVSHQFDLLMRLVHCIVQIHATIFVDSMNNKTFIKSTYVIDYESQEMLLLTREISVQAQSAKLLNLAYLP